VGWFSQLFLTKAFVDSEWQTQRNHRISNNMDGEHVAMRRFGQVCECSLSQEFAGLTAVHWFDIYS